MTQTLDLTEIHSLVAQARKMGPVGVLAADVGRAAREARRRHVVKQIAQLRMEGLELYCALPVAAEFHESRAKWRIADGANRASKTFTCAAEFSRFFCGCDPFDKYVRRGGHALIVGLDLDHIGMMWAKCSRPGEFKVVRDEQTGFWRSVRPDASNPLLLDPYDEAYREKWRDAPPLIPPRMIRSVAWEDRAKGIPRYVTGVTGCRSLWRSSDGKPPQGDHYTFGWLDEQLGNDQFYVELNRGLVALDEPQQHWPKGVWSATAQTTNIQLSELREKAEEGSENVAAFQFLIEHNPYIPDEEKRAFFDSLNYDERQTRYYGLHALVAKRVYPTYEPQGIHGCEPQEIPPHWTRYVALDPGYEISGTIFGAIDPDEAHAWVYDGFELRNAGAEQWALEVKRRQGDRRFECFVIDQSMGRQHQASHAITVAQEYYAALEQAGVRPRVEGPLDGFFPGSRDVAARSEALRGWMSIRGSGPFTGTPRLKVMRGLLPELDRQLKYARMEGQLGKTRSRVKDKRAVGPHDLLDALEYWAGFHPGYHEPEEIRADKEDRVWLAFQEKQRRARQKSGTIQDFGPGLEIG